MAMVEAQVYEKPAFLSPGKFQRYASMLFTKGTWRIGTVPDGSCFFHALLTATDKDYRALAKQRNREGTQEERCATVSDLRRNLARKLTPQVWNFLQKGEPRHFAMISALRGVETRASGYLRQPAEKQEWIGEAFQNSREAMQLVLKVISGDLFDLSNFSQACKGEGGYTHPTECDKVFCKQQIARYVKLLSENIQELVDEHGVDVVEASAEGFSKFVKEAVRHARTIGLKRVRHHFSDPGQWIGTEFLPFLSDQFNTNIFIISGETGLPYLQGNKQEDYSKSRGSIFLLAVDDTHYECLGFEVADDNGGKPKVRCKVAWDHPYVESSIGLLSREGAEMVNPAISRALYGDSPQPPETQEDSPETVAETAEEQEEECGGDVLPWIGNAEALLMALQEA